MGKRTPEVTAVNDLRSHIGFWLRFVSNHVSHDFRRRLLDTGITVAEWVLLREMFGRDEMAPSDLADLTGMTRGAASKLLDRLLAKNLITREGRSDDRRFQIIALTRQAREVVPALAAIADQNDHDFFSPLSEKERATLVSTMKKLVKAHGLHKLPTE